MAQPPRSLTEGEKTVLRSVFGDAINFDTVKVYNVPFAPGMRISAPNGNVYWPDGQLNRPYSADFSTAPLSVLGTFVHEMVHVWQYQRGVNVIDERTRQDQQFANPYEYYSRIRSGVAFVDLPVEAQAAIVEDMFLASRNVLRPLTIDQYRQLVPTQEQMKVYEFKSSLPSFPREPQCFAAGTMIDMADGTQKPIEQVRVGDWVMSFDDQGRKVPGRVTREFRNQGWVFPFQGVWVTPGHHYKRGDGPGYERIDSILEHDGTVVRADGTVLRARTGFPVGSFEDRPMQVAWRSQSGEYQVMYMRAGTPCGLDLQGRVVLIGPNMIAQGYRLRADGLLENAEGESGHYEWDHGTPPPHLEIGRQMSLGELLRWSETSVPLLGFTAPPPPSDSELRPSQVH